MNKEEMETIGEVIHEEFGNALIPVITNYAKAYQVLAESKMLLDDILECVKGEPENEKQIFGMIAKIEKEMERFDSYAKWLEKEAKEDEETSHNR